MSLPLTGPVADRAKPGYEGYQYWVDELNANGGLLGRPGRAQGARRRLRPADRDLRLHQADRPGQGRPRARHLLVGSQPRRRPDRRALQVRLRRALGRRRRDLRAQLQVPVLRPAGDDPEAARAVRERCCEAAPDGAAPGDGRVRHRRGPEHDASSRRSSSATSRRSGLEDRATSPPTRPDATNFDAIANAVKRREPGPRRQRLDRRRTGSSSSARCRSSASRPKMLYQTNTPTDPAFADGDRRGQHRGHPDLPRPTAPRRATRATPSSSRATRSSSAPRRARTRPTPTPPGRSWPRRSRPSASSTRTRSPSGCTRTPSTRSSGR